MNLSQQILQLLDLLAERRLTVDFPIDAVEEWQDGLSDAEQLEGRRDEQSARVMRKWIADAKLKPVRATGDEVINVLEELVGGDSGLDEHFTVAALAEVPHLVRRWKRLQATHVILLPGEKVTRYLGQATVCYLYGFFEASSMVARSLLQFTLEEAFAELGGVGAIQTEPGKRDYLENLIRLAAKTLLAPGTRILPDILVGKAHQIRTVGNKCAHRESCSGSEALQVLQNAADILRHIYGRGLTRKGWNKRTVG